MKEEESARVQLKSSEDGPESLIYFILQSGLDGRVQFYTSVWQKFQEKVKDAG